MCGLKRICGLGSVCEEGLTHFKATGQSCTVCVAPAGKRSSPATHSPGPQLWHLTGLQVCLLLSNDWAFLFQSGVKCSWCVEFC